MVAVGERTGNLTSTLTTVAESYDMETGDRINRAVALIQPTITLAVALLIFVIALTLVSTMFGLYGQLE